MHRYFYADFEFVDACFDKCSKYYSYEQKSLKKVVKTKIHIERGHLFILKKLGHDSRCIIVLKAYKIMLQKNCENHQHSYEKY